MVHPDQDIFPNHPRKVLVQYPDQLNPEHLLQYNDLLQQQLPLVHLKNEPYVWQYILTVGHGRLNL